MRYDAEHKQKTRERVLKEAAKAIRTDGPDRIAVAGIMAKVGLTHGGFYAHFASKDELIAQSIEQMFLDARRKFARTTEGLPPKQALTAYIDFYLSSDHRESRDIGCPLAALSADLPRLSDAAREGFGRGVAGLTDALAGQLRAAGYEDSDNLAPSILSELVGALSLSRAVADSAQSDTFLDRSREALKRRLGLEIFQ
jgi:TetR/AcrR family transcriptional regulator, transcriptional repressor for nem operon